MIGRRLLHYEIIEKVGEGGMGVVYKARDTHLDRFVAIKVLRPERLSDQNRKARFVQEAKAASALNHPNIVTIHDISSDSGHDFIAMEYVAGNTLDQLITRRGMHLTDALKISVQIAGALARAHSAGIVHRDLKPANIIVDDHGLVKLLDFGLAKLTEQDLSEDDSTATAGVATEEGAIVGTASYMSPEQAEGRKVDARSDIFSFGAVLYEMVSGRRAFQGESKLAILSAVLHKEPPPVEDAPPELKKIIVRCLRKDPERRLQHMDDLRVALADLKEESESGTLMPAPKPRIASRRTRFAALGVVTVVLALAATGWWWVWRNNRAARPSVGAPQAVTSYRGAEEDATLSPDGRHVAFSANVESQSNFDIYVKLIGSEPPLRLTRDPDRDEAPRWSPDGRWIAFGRGGRKLILISPLGGPERTIAGDLRSPAILWSADSQYVIVPVQTEDARRPATIAISIATGERRQLSWPPGAAGIGRKPASPSPDGRQLAFLRVDLGSPRLYVAPLSAGLELGEPRWLDWVKPTRFDSCTWTRDGQDLICSMRLASFGAQALWRVRMGRRDPPELLPFSEDAYGPTISAVGARLVFERARIDQDIWRLQDPFAQSGPAPVRFISSTRHDHLPQYSPDGARVAFVSARSGQSEIWVAAADSSQPRMLTNLGASGQPSWSPDGSLIVFAHAGAMYTVDTGGGMPRSISSTPAVKAAWPAYSKNGQWIYFQAELGGQAQVWRMPAAGGAALQVTQHGGMQPSESPDGRFLLYMKWHDQRYSLWRMPTSGGTERQLIASSSSFRPIQYALASDRLYCIRYENPDQLVAIDLIDFESDAIRRTRTLQLSSRFNGPGLSVSPDGRSLLYVAYEYESDLIQFENFR